MSLSRCNARCLKGRTFLCQRAALPIVGAAEDDGSPLPLLPMASSREYGRRMPNAIPECKRQRLSLIAARWLVLFADHAPATRRVAGKVPRRALLVAMGALMACSEHQARTTPVVESPDPAKATAADTAADVPEVAGAINGKAGAQVVAAGSRSGNASPPSPPPIVLDDTPSINILHNRFLMHLSPRDSQAGIYIPLASEGVRKYSQEYRNPFGDVVKRDGRKGRVLSSRSLLLRLPWLTAWSANAGSATLRLRIHGLVAGQKLSMNLNGKRLTNIGLQAGWQETDIEISDISRLRAGENEVRLFLGKRGPNRDYALLHSLSLVPATPNVKPNANADTETPGAAAAAGISWPPLSPVAEVAIGGDTMPALTGFARMTLYSEIPQQAYLHFHTGVDSADNDTGSPASNKDVDFRIYAHVATGDIAAEQSKTVELFRHRAGPGMWQEHYVDVAEIAGKLVALHFESSSADGAAWAKPRIALPQAAMRQRPKTFANTILLVIDALRSDRLALYGETRVATPHMTADGRARGVVFLHNQAASPSSPPSHGSIQTGMIPRVHGVAGDKSQLKPGTPMISTQLEDAGVRTAYYGNNPFGMARLKEPGGWTAFHQPNQEGKGIDCTVLMKEMLTFAEKHGKAGERFFISSLPYEPHTPYRYHEGITDAYYDGPWDPVVGKSVDGVLLGKLSSGSTTLNQRQWQQLKALYDGEVAHMDGCYKQLVDGLNSLGLREDTLIVITSDHGEGMFEHGRMGHAFGHYAELANVPFVLVGDGLLPGDGIVIDTVSSHLDIAPTILDLMGVTPDQRIQGSSLMPVLLRQGPWTPRVMPLEYGRSYALRSQRWKYIVDYQGQESIFDLASDPTEQVNLLRAGTGADSSSPSPSFSGPPNGPMALRYMRDIAGIFLIYRSVWRMDTFGTFNNHGRGFLEHLGVDLQ